MIRSRSLPLAFLRGIGFPDLFINNLRTLFADASKFYSCFISYTEADDEFSKKLYNDLQNAGIRCWRWREDAKIGSPMMQEVNRAIQQYDKLIVICSKHSLQSQPVIREINRALKKEDIVRKQNPEADVLFPVRLDDTILSWKHHLQPDVENKVIGDFRDWKNQQKYQNEFKKLLRALKKEN